jgi:hypothetical protein
MQGEWMGKNQAVGRRKDPHGGYGSIPKAIPELRESGLRVDPWVCCDQDKESCGHFCGSKCGLGPWCPRQATLQPEATSLDTVPSDESCICLLALDHNCIISNANTILQ